MGTKIHNYNIIFQKKKEEELQQRFTTDRLGKRVSIILSNCPYRTQVKKTLNIKRIKGSKYISTVLLTYMKNNFCSYEKKVLIEQNVLKSI